REGDGFFEGVSRVDLGDGVDEGEDALRGEVIAHADKEVGVAKDARAIEEAATDRGIPQRGRIARLVDAKGDGLDEGEREGAEAVREPLGGDDGGVKARGEPAEISPIRR